MPDDPASCLTRDCFIAERVALQNSHGLLKADVYVYMQDGQRIICKDYQRYKGSLLSWPAQLLLRHEAHILNRLHDWPHSPSVVGYVGKFALLMEYVPGEMLGATGAGADPMLFSQLLGVMKSLHSYSIAHNDVRGSNIIVGKNGITLIDFASAIHFPTLVRALFSPLRRSDLSGVLKYKKRITGEEPTSEEKHLYGKPQWIHRVQVLWKKKLLPWFKLHSR